MRGYDETTAAQAANFFAVKAGGSINVLKLVKLMYLAERGYMQEYDEPMFFDNLLSMNYGPVVSRTLDLINGMSGDRCWSQYIGSRQDNFLSAVKNVDLDHLSNSELEVLENVWQKFGHMSEFDLADWTHWNIPEWENPNGSAFPISHEIVFKFLGKSNAEGLSAEVSKHRAIKEAFGSEA